MVKQRSGEPSTETVTEPPAAGGPLPLAGLRGWCLARPTRCVVAGFLLLVAGGRSFLAATGQRSVGLSILLALGGALIGAIGLLLLNEPVAGYVKAHPRRGRLIGVLTLVVGFVVVWFAIGIESPILAVVGAVIVLLALLAINAWLLVGGVAKGGLLLTAGLIGLIASPALVWFGDGVDGWSIAAVPIWVVGLVLFKVGLPPWIDRRRIERRMTVTVDSILATGLGVLLLFLASRSFSEGALLFGLMLSVAGLSSLGISTARFDPSRLVAWLLLLGGLVAIGVGAVLTNDIVSLELVTAVVALVVAAVGAWFVFRGEALIAVLLLGFIVGWVLVDRTSEEPLDPYRGSQLMVLAVGDSYISGEGAPRFFDGTNVVGDNGNQCRRSGTAYPYLVADRLNASLIFLACSGAKTIDMDNQGDLTDPFPEVAGGEDQIQRLLAVHGDQVDRIDVVLVSAGGNDVGFSTIIKACLLPESCATPELNDGWLRNVAETRQQLVATYLTLKEAVGDDTPIVAMLYPIIVGQAGGCELPIGADEIDFVIEFTTALNDTVIAAAAEAGINVLGDSADAFEGRLLCDEDPATNFFHLAPTNGPIADTVLPANWVHGTLHPRADGHELIADRLVTVDDEGRRLGYLVDLLASIDDGGPANPPPGPGPGPGVPQYEDLPDDEWVEEQLYRTVDDLIPPLGLLLFGGLIAAFGVVKARLPFLDFLDPSNNQPTNRTD